MAVGRTIRWMFIILLLIAVAVSGAGYWVWLRGDDLIRDGIQKRFAELAPDWDLGLQSVRFDGDRRLHLSSLSLQEKGSTGRLIEIPEAIITVDREQFLRSQELIIERVRLIRPKVSLHRNLDGSWNWQRFPKLPASKGGSPDLQLEDATVFLSWDQADTLGTMQLTLANTDLKVTPAAKNVFDIVGRSRVNNEASMSLDGWANLDKRTWRIRGKMDQLAASSNLLQMAASSSSRIQTSMNDFGGGVGARVQNVQTASNEPFPSNGPLMQVRNQTIPGLGISGTLNILLDAGSKGPNQKTDFQVKVNVIDGTIDNAAVPFPLSGVNGTLVWRNQQLELSEVRATHGDTQLKLDAALVIDDQTSPVVNLTELGDPNRNRLGFSVTDLKLDSRLRASLPPSLQRIYDKVRPAGVVDIKGQFVKRANGRWEPANVVAKLKGCSANPIQFQYPVHAGVGHFRQRGETKVYDLEIDARAGDQLVKVKGWLSNPGPEAESQIDIAVDNLPIDKTFRDALDNKGRKVLDTLRVTGLADAHVTLYRPPGFGQKTEPIINARVRHGSVNLRSFPYPLTEITGNLKFNPATRRWTFEKLKGYNGQASISVAGWFDTPPRDQPNKPGVLRLALRAEDAKLDQALKTAVGPALQQAWNELRPTGTFSMDADLDWVAIPNRPVDLTVKTMSVTDGTLFLKSFPYQFRKVQGQVTYSTDANRLSKIKFSKFTGVHESTTVQGQGSFDELPNGGWNLHLTNVQAKKVAADASLLRAIPTDLRLMLEELDPTNPFQIEDAEIDLLQRTGSSYVTAAWDLKTRLLGGRVTAGLYLDNIRGVVTSTGTWNGRDLENTGRIQISSVDVLEHRLTNISGPYSADNNNIVVGSARALGSDRARVPISQRLTAKAYDGQLTFDAVVPMTDAPWQMLAIVSRSKLETYARSKFPSQSNISGVVNGWISLSGRGDVDTSVTGKGEVQVSPAALYELPVVFQMFDALSKFNFGSPEQVAFDYAKTSFNVAQGKFIFNPIDLVGNALSLRGKGYVGFDGRLGLNFFFHDPRKPKLLSALVNQATRGWVGVYVSGNLDRPHTEVRTGVPVSDAMNNFMRAINQPTQAPLKLNIPNLFSGR